MLAVQLAGPQRLGADESGVAAAVGDGAVFSQSASTWVRWATASRWRPRPSSARLYDTARVLYRICDAMGCISWDGNLYEVPYEHVTDYLLVRVTSEQVLIYDRDLSGRDVPQRSRGADLDVLRPAFDALGEGADAYLRGLDLGAPRPARCRPHSPRAHLLPPPAQALLSPRRSIASGSPVTHTGSAELRCPAPSRLLRRALAVFRPPI